jgi:hypothetical protein
VPLAQREPLELLEPQEQPDQQVLLEPPEQQELLVQLELQVLLE